MTARALAVLLLAALPAAAADDAEIAKGLRNLREIFATAQTIELRHALGTTPQLKALADPWGTPYRIDLDPVRIVSAGSDRRFDESTWSQREQFRNLEGDVVFAGRNFVRTNHNWLCAQAAPGGASEAALKAMRTAEMLFLVARTEGMQKTMGIRFTATALENVGILVEAFRRKHAGLAKLALPADALRVLFEDAGVNMSESRDAWGTPLRLIVEGETYRIASAGADRRFEPSTWKRPASLDPSEDLVFENGRISRRPDELQLMAVLGRTTDPLPQPPDRALRDDPHSPYARLDKTVTAPVVVTRKEPAYPEAYRRVGISGIVILETALSGTGAVDNVAVLKSLGPALDAAAIEAVRKWTFRPATRADKPVAALFNVTINFKLE
jgi:TonB family protein